MSKIVLVAGILILLIAAGSAYILIRPQPVSAPTESTSGGNAAVGANGESVIVTYTDKGFSPVSLTITPGTTVTWNNQSSHPLSVFKSASVTKDGTFSYTFTTPGTFAYENAENTSDDGTIVVSGDAPAAGPINPISLPQ